MNRSIWIARIFALIIIVAFAVLMMNLYGKLRRMSPAPAPPAAASPGL